MSDTTSPENPVDDDAPLPIANYGFLKKPMTVDGETETWAEVRFGVNATNMELPAHAVEIRDVDMGDQFDLAEIAGQQVDNGIWLSLAIVAMSVQSIDGIPVPRGNLTKLALKKTLKKIGPLGVRAVRRGLNELNGATSGSNDEIKAAAGN